MELVSPTDRRYNSDLWYTSFSKSIMYFVLHAPCITEDDDINMIYCTHTHIYMYIQYVKVFFVIAAYTYIYLFSLLIHDPHLLEVLIKMYKRASIFNLDEIFSPILSCNVENKQINKISVLHPCNFHPTSSQLGSTFARL